MSSLMKTEVSRLLWTEIISTGKTTRMVLCKSILKEKPGQLIVKTGCWDTDGLRKIIFTQKSDILD